MTRVISSVTSDLTMDQRVNKIAKSLSKLGFDVLLIGRKLHNREYIKERPYKTKRFHLLFNSGPLFYATYNLRLFFTLLTKPCELLIANDLDTLLANFLVSKIKGIPLIYDTHEYFCHVPELSNRPFVRSVWKCIERWIFPKIKTVITVNGSLAKLYAEEYNIKVHTIHNFPESNLNTELKTKKKLGIPENKKLILYQGAVNIDRGLEEAIEAMTLLADSVLLIIGTGDILPDLKTLVIRRGLADRIKFFGAIPFQDLPNYTHHADFGIAIEKDTNLNYKYSLSNKIFDYINADIPVLASPLPEVKKLFSEHDIGLMVENYHPDHLADKMKEMTNNIELQRKWKRSLVQARQKFTWDKEEKTLSNLLDKLGLL